LEDDWLYLYGQSSTDFLIAYYKRSSDYFTDYTPGAFSFYLLPKMFSLLALVFAGPAVSQMLTKNQAGGYWELDRCGGYRVSTVSVFPFTREALVSFGWLLGCMLIQPGRLGTMT